MTVTVDDLEELDSFLRTPDGVFGGFDVLGYIGNSGRNYVTDAWVLAGANDLEWSLVELGEWVCSVWGRYALDAGPMSADEMRAEMARADMAALFQEALG